MAAVDGVLQHVEVVAASTDLKMLVDPRPKQKLGEKSGLAR